MGFNGYVEQNGLVKQQINQQNHKMNSPLIKQATRSQQAESNFITS